MFWKAREEDATMAQSTVITVPDKDGDCQQCWDLNCVCPCEFLDAMGSNMSREGIRDVITFECKKYMDKPVYLARR